MDNTPNPAGVGALEPAPSEVAKSARTRHPRAKVRRRIQGAARRWLWAILAFLMLIVGGVAACQAPSWLGPSHHEPSLAKPAQDGRR